MLLTYNLMWIMRRAFELAWRSPRCCLYLHGKSGSLKTTVATFLSQMQNRKNGIKNPPRFNSTQAAFIDLLLEKDDCVLVLDDLCPSKDPKKRREQENLLNEICREVGDEVSPFKKQGNEVKKRSPKCGVIFTAEYVLDGCSSDFARFIAVEMKRPDGEKLKQFQEKPLLVSTFYRSCS